MRVLLGIGGSDDSFTALEATAERVRTTGDDLSVAVVDDPSTDRTYADIEARVREVLDAADVEADVRRIEGDAGSRLVNIAESEGFDCITLGGGQRTPMGKITLSQVAEFVLLNSRVTVTLVR